MFLRGDKMRAWLHSFALNAAKSGQASVHVVIHAPRQTVAVLKSTRNGGRLFSVRDTLLSGWPLIARGSAAAPTISDSIWPATCQHNLIRSRLPLVQSTRAKMDGSWLRLRPVTAGHGNDDPTSFGRLRMGLSRVVTISITLTRIAPTTVWKIFSWSHPPSTVAFTCAPTSPARVELRASHRGLGASRSPALCAVVGGN